eukprot:10725159-Alexandrium_andersonii.AAC.1
MSASLVGSEMCIRDRSEVDRQAPEAALRAAHGLAGGEALRRRRGERPRAVSYTHLTLPTICSV